MTDLKPNAQEDKDVESVSDSPGPTQEPLQSHTSSPKNNAAGNSLPSGALVNGPGSHPTSEVRCVLNKGSVLSNNVLDTEWQPAKDASPQVLPPPSELQSDAWKNTAGLVLKTLPTQPGVNTPLSNSEENESKLPYSTLSGDSSDQMHISQPLINKTIKTGSPRDLKTEGPESFLDDYDDTEVIRWDSPKEVRHSLRNDRAIESRWEKKTKVMPHLMSQSESKHNTNAVDMLEKVNNSLNHTHKRFCTGNDVDDFDSANKHVSLDTKSDFKYSVVPFRDHSKNTDLDTEQNICSKTEKDCKREIDPEDEKHFSTKLEQWNTEQPEKDPLFFPCTICNVNFKEKRHLHRHMMYHLGRHNQVHYENVPQPFICRECGRLFCDSTSLMKHIIIHKDRLQKLMDEIKGLKKLENEDRCSTLQCPQCVFGCNCPKTFVQHANTHDNLKHYYFCEECNYITLTQQALEAHLHDVHLKTHQPKYLRTGCTNDAEETDHPQFRCKFCSFTSGDKQILQRHTELEHQQSFFDDFEKTVFDKMSEYNDTIVSHLKLADQTKTTSSKPARCEPNLCCTQPVFWRRADFTCWSGKSRDIYKKNPDTLNSYKSFSSSQFKCSVGCNASMLPPSLWKIDKHGKSLEPVEKITTGLTCAEEDDQNNNHKASGSSKQKNCPSTSDILLTAENGALDQMFCQGSNNGLANISSEKQASLNSPSKRKLSTPLSSNIDKMKDYILPKFSQRLMKQSTHGDVKEACEDSNDNFLDGSENERNPSARSCFKERQKFSVKEKSFHVGQVAEDEDNEDDDCSDVEQLIIKEEYIETAVCDESPESPSMPTSDPFDISPTSGVEHKPCPYCPAVFESGVGLSNHVRGHLHRVGLSYNARHMVSPEQVALQDRQPRIRKRIPSAMRRLKKAEKPESQGEHTCPLCWGWFDTKTGLSNHVRGHLKRIGQTVTSNKSPVCILNELLQDKKEHQNILQILNKDQLPSSPFVSQKFISSDGLFLMRTGIPVKIQYGMRSPTPLDSFVSKQEAEELSERKQLRIEAQRANEPSSSTLVELLKTRQKGMELKEINGSSAARKHFNMTKEMEETQVTSVESNWANGECDSNKICIHCNTTFPSGISLSNHLRAYARRKRIAILEETSYDYRQKKPRLRPGLKKKVLPSLNAEIYRLTCRFCDLVFQGPLSVQEDWIKHLQRHLMHTSVPHSGTGMVEVLGLHQEINSMSHEHPNLDQTTSSLELPVPS
ncbi:zinc finger protein 644 isoform X2 [Myripristis murdjan]|uniref:zinc finger protein 644 isoform X2 n=1 Tax=Myripristis murdjan TaxID=586833 RepID=UPI0011760712|nr:zinc finger protein 644 isoform X2 [Myripristis murdjan]